MGDVVHVKPGYARNFLLPQRKAVRATAENRKRFESERVQLEAVNLERRSEAQHVATKLHGISIVLIRQAGESGQLYGSVSARDVADAVTADGFTIGRQQVRMQAPIKTLGLHTVLIALHPEVVVSITANVARSPDEAALQARTGGAVTRSDEELEIADEELHSATDEARSNAAVAPGS
jgi:large subunit ribosomal protein L9